MVKQCVLFQGKVQLSDLVLKGSRNLSFQARFTQREGQFF